MQYSEDGFSAAAGYRGQDHDYPRSNAGESDSDSGSFHPFLSQYLTIETAIRFEKSEKNGAIPRFSVNLHCILRRLSYL
ncbi:MAG: hypothetical protein D6820_17165 [Lentisphaerae bacterium]|nr:MAG: hypothetical protein D6820_17165 [Lentisphaerota bacterium]